MTALALYRVTETVKPFTQVWATMHAKCAEEAREAVPDNVVVERQPAKIGPSKLGETCDRCGGA